MTTWDHQQRALAHIEKAESEGARAVLVVSPTGSGKTTMAARRAARARADGQTVIALAPRVEIADQIFDRFRLEGLEPGMICTQSTRPERPGRPVQVALPQTMIARGILPANDVALVDEAHHFADNTFSDLLKDCRRVVGFTATPERGDGKGMKATFDRLVVAATVRELVDAGILVVADIDRPRRQLRPGTICARPVDAYMRAARGSRAIVFSPTVHAAEEHAAEFRAQGIEAHAISSKTSAERRAFHLERFRSGACRVLVNVFVLTEGFDAPECDCIILARDFGTTGTYLQACGRGGRSRPGKKFYRLLDLHGTTYTHGRPEDNRIYSLEGRAIRREGDVDALEEGTSCRVCGAPTVPRQPCTECGTEPRAMLVPKVKPTPMVKYAHIREEPIEARIERFAGWIATARARKYSPKWYRMQFKVFVGHWPSREIEAAALKLLEERAA
jgi:DNA repair protein RadD